MMARTLTFTTLLANSVDDKLVIFNGDNLHETSNHVFWEKQEKYFNVSSAKNFTQSAKY